MSVISSAGSSYSRAAPGPTPSQGYQQLGNAMPINVLDPRYGAKGDGVTDDTGAVQAAVNAASAQSTLNGIVDVWLPPGYGFNLGAVTAKNNTRIWAYGATIFPNLAGITNGLFTVSFTDLSRFEIRGGTWQGSGSETNFQTVFGKTGGTTGITDCQFRDMFVTGWGCAPLYLINPTRLVVADNVILNPGNGGQALNAIAISALQAAAHGNILVTRNMILGAAEGAIGYSNSQSAGSGPINLEITNNVCLGIAGNANHVSGAIFLEFDIATGGPWTDFLLADNIVFNPNTAASSFAMSFGVAGATFQKVKVRGNDLKATVWGIQYQRGQDIEISGNRIDAPTPIQATGAGQTYNGSGNQFSTGPSQGRATLVAGTVTVNTSEIQAGDNVLLSVVSPAGTRGEIQLGAIVAGTSFVINSIQPGTASTLQAADTSTVFWQIIH